MTKTPYHFKYKYHKNWGTIYDNLKSTIEALMINAEGDKTDFKVEIMPFNSRSLNALNAYWMLIDTIVKWDEDNHGYKKNVWDEWFKTEASLTKTIDMLPLWKMKYKDKIKDGWDFELRNEDECFLFKAENPLFNIETGRRYTGRCTRRYTKKTRSISDKGDVTKQEMERLLNCILKFGAENDVPNCEIKSTELERMLKAYD